MIGFVRFVMSVCPLFLCRQPLLPLLYSDRLKAAAVIIVARSF